ncbi:MAG: YggS family pyridoxal phosphate-dependent enzyme [Candidatus Bipolaricaulota bacterium]
MISQRCLEILRQLPAGVTVVAAAKGRTPEEVRAALRSGIAHVGENYVQDAERKRPLVPEPATWHMIGHLQRNKANTAVGVFDWVQTVDSLALAERIEAALARAGKTLPVLVQVNIGREPGKAGVLPEAVPAFVRELAQFPNLRVRGLLAIPPAPNRPEDSRPHFRAMRKLFEDLRAEASASHMKCDATRCDATGFNILSMGMSADWEVAVEEGATMIRLGTALFGPHLTSPRRGRGLG